MDFFKDIENTFKEELETSENFKEYFTELKNDKKYFKFENSPNLHIDQDETEQKTASQEVISAMVSNTFDKELYKKHFAGRKSQEEVISEWISCDEVDKWYRQGRELGGITNENENDMFDKLRLEKPHLVDEKFINFSQNFGENFDSLLMDLIKSNDIFEDEYYFNPESSEKIEEHLARISALPNVKITIKKDQKGRYLIKRQHKPHYKYDLDEIMNTDLTKEKEKITEIVENSDFSTVAVNEIEFKFQIQNLMKKYLKLKQNEDLEKIKENMKNLTEEDENNLSNDLIEIISEETENLKPESKKEIASKVLTSMKEGKNIDAGSEKFPLFLHDSFTFYQKLKSRLNQKSRQKIFLNVDQPIREDLEKVIRNKISKFTGKQISTRALRTTIMSTISISAEELNRVLNSIVHILQKSEEIPVVRTSLDDNSIALLLILVEKNNADKALYNLNEDNKLTFLTKHLFKPLLDSICSELNQIEKISTYSLFGILPEEVELQSENHIDRNKFFANMWGVFKKTVINSNLSTLIQKAEENNLLKEHEFTLEKEYLNSNRTEESVKKEINEYSSRIKGFYHDLIRLNPTELDWENYISDIDTFTYEISEQIADKLYRRKHLTKWKKSDFVEERLNEENLYRAQKKNVDETLEALEEEKIGSLDDDETLNKIQENIKKLKQKKQKLRNEKKPVYDDEYLRIL